MKKTTASKGVTTTLDRELVTQHDELDESVNAPEDLIEWYANYFKNVQSREADASPNENWQLIWYRRPIELSWKKIGRHVEKQAKELLVQFEKTGAKDTEYQLTALCAVTLDMTGRLTKSMAPFVSRKLDESIPNIKKKMWPIGTGSMKARNLALHLSIALAVYEVTSRGYDATRNSKNTARLRSDRRQSGCSIICQALHKARRAMSEDNVEKIWKRFKDTMD